MKPASLGLFASISRLHIVAIATLGTFTFGWLFTGTYPWLISVWCAFDWFIVNLLNRVVDLEEDKTNAIRGTTFVARHRRALTALGFGLLIGSLVLGHILSPTVTIFRIAYHTLGLTYNWRLLPGKKRIKELYFFKNTASATGFMLTVFCYPVAAVQTLAPGISWTTIAITGAYFFVFELSYEVLYDLRDAPVDKLAGVKTFAVVHGQAGAVRIIDGLLLSSIILLVGGYAAGHVPWRIFVMVAAPALQWVLYKRFMRRGIQSADCILLTWLGAGLLLAYHLWVVAGLPGVNA